jgi:anthraniloyl-CoA monooxygenase
MKITIIGGGPAGLYFALLMKKHAPSHEITVWERNAPGDTFGWGVVFSDKTLSYLRDTDEETYQEITRSFATWDNVDVVHRDERVTIRGNKFSGIARLKLLNILQERCRTLGVDLRFRAEVASVGEFADADLIVGADGVNSTVREHYREAFQPSLGVRHNKYIWYGTHQLFHGLTLTFRESEAGVFAAHSYKFDAETSTFIVECDAETWAAARSALEQFEVDQFPAREEPPLAPPQRRAARRRAAHGALLHRLRHEARPRRLNRALSLSGRRLERRRRALGV